MSSPGDTPGPTRPRLTLVGGSGGAAQRQRATTPARDSGEPVVRARLAALTDRCWQCRTKVRGIVGVLVDPARTPDSTGFLPFDDVVEMLADRLDPRALAGRRIGRNAGVERRLDRVELGEGPGVERVALHVVGHGRSWPSSSTRP